MEHTIDNLLTSTRQAISMGPKQEGRASRKGDRAQEGVKPPKSGKAYYVDDHLNDDLDDESVKNDSEAEQVETEGLQQKSQLGKKRKGTEAIYRSQPGAGHATQANKRHRNATRQRTVNSDGPASGQDGLELRFAALENENNELKAAVTKLERHQAAVVAKLQQKLKEAEESLKRKDDELKKEREVVRTMAQTLQQTVAMMAQTGRALPE